MRLHATSRFRIVLRATYRPAAVSPRKHLRGRLFGGAPASLKQPLGTSRKEKRDTAALLDHQAHLAVICAMRSQTQ